jgi:hypothetical protein
MSRGTGSELGQAAASGPTLFPSIFLRTSPASWGGARAVRAGTRRLAAVGRARPENLGNLLQDRGDLPGAQALYREALAMRRQLFPVERFPAGHPELAINLNNLASVLWAGGAPAQAEPLSHDALAMEQRLADLALEGAAEAEACNYLAALPLARDAYLGVTRLVPAQHAADYAALWDGKAAVARLLERRRQALLLTADPTTRDLGCRLLAARRDLARLLLAAALTDEQARRVRELTERMEHLEKQLARRLPAFAAVQARAKLRPADLQEHLPAGAVFVDLLRYLRFDFDPAQPGRAGEKRTECSLRSSCAGTGCRGA